MRDLRRYWQEIRAVEKTLPPFPWLVSLDDPKRGWIGGRMVEVSAVQAAQLLHTKSHRLATEEEIAAHLEQENEKRRKSFDDNLRRKGVACVPVVFGAPKPETTDTPARAKRR